MKYNRIEINAESYLVSFYCERTGKTKVKEFSAYHEWLCNHALACDDVVTVPQGTEEVYTKAFSEKWKEELKKHFSSRCGNGVSVTDIQINYEIIKNKPCASYSIKECLEIMTPEQFFSEFGQIAIDSIRNM